MRPTFGLDKVPGNGWHAVLSCGRGPRSASFRPTKTSTDPPLRHRRRVTAAPRRRIPGRTPPTRRRRHCASTVFHHYPRTHRLARTTHLALAMNSRPAFVGAATGGFVAATPAKAAVCV